MATFTNRPDRPADTRWLATVRRKGFPTQCKSFPTKAEASDWAHALETEMRRGAFIDQSAARNTLMSELFTKYRNEVSFKKKGGNVEAARLDAMQRWPLAKYSASNVTGDVLAACRDWRLSQVSGSTVNRELNLLSHIFTKAMKEWKIALPANPVSLIERPKNNKSRERRFQEGEEALLLYECRKARNKFLHPAVILAIETSMRRSEIVGIEWPRVDLAKKVLYLSDSKNGEGRWVPLSTRAVTALSKIETDRNGRVFPGLTVDAIKCAYKRARKRAKIEGLRFHDLRHEATSRFFEKDLSLMEAAAITGHKDLRMLKRYTHLRAEVIALKLG